MIDLAYAEPAENQPRVGLIGAGPVGSLLATGLSANRVPFYWAERSQARREELAVRLVRRERGDDTPIPAGRYANVELTSSAQEFGYVEWLIVAVKAHQVDQALSEVRIGKVRRVLAVTNGLVEGGFYLGLLYGGARLQDGALTHAPSNVLHVGALEGKGDALARLSGLLESSWLRVECEDEIRLHQWHKLAMNCVVNPLTTLLNCTNEHLLPLLESPLINGLLTEFCQVAKLELGEAWRYQPAGLLKDVAQLLEMTAGNSSSMREDFLNGRETEISHLNLAIAKLGREHGCNCPINETLSRMVSSHTNTGLALTV